MTDVPSSIDGVRESGPAVQPQSAAPLASVKRWKRVLSVMTGGSLIAYLLWSALLIALLPDRTGLLQPLEPVALMTAVVGGVGALVLGLLGILRIGSSGASPEVQQRSAIRLALVIAPGLLASIALPILILREPSLTLDITEPTATEDFIAPLNVTYSLADAVRILGLRDRKPVRYEWDVDGDNKPDEKTVVPTVTVSHERDGVFTVTGRIFLSDGTTRAVVRRIIIRQAVFSVQPARPVIGRPAVFSVANLVSDPNTLKEVQWDFNGDGQPDEVTKDTEAAFTFYTLGKKPVAATIAMTTSTQTTYNRTVDVVDPVPLAFPATLSHEPTHLIAPAPFGVRFTVETQEPVASMTWSFGDGTQAEGADVAHTFTKRGRFPVTVKLRSISGSLVELTELVRVADPLNLSDLAFDGTPAVRGDTISGEVPLTLDLRPRTAVPFVTFQWDVKDATEVGSTESALKAVYRRVGTYRVTLIAQDAEEHVFRKTYTVEVKPRSNEVVMVMRPESGVAPLSVAFDASASFIPGEDITGYEWSFGDRTPRVTGSARAEHVYEQPGTYVVNLTVRTVSGKEFQTNKTLVVRPPPLTACITPSRLVLQAGGGVQFDPACSAGEWTSIRWNFSDGTQTTEERPVHLFEQPGEFTATLTLTDAGLREATASVTIRVTE